MSAEAALARLLARWAHEPDPDLAPRVAAAAGLARAADAGDAELWRRFLETTGESAFLVSLPDHAERHAWADLVFWALRRADFGIGDLLDWRVRTRGETIYLHDLGRDDEPTLTFAQTQWRARRVAARLLGPEPRERPRPCVALLAANTLGGAVVDLACLAHDIPVAPLNVQEDTATLAWICDRLAVADMVVDTPDRLQRALEIRERVACRFDVHLLTGTAMASDDVRLLDHDLAGLTAVEVDRRLATRPRLKLDDPCTVLFTSGSTGRPKGIAFTPFNLVSKRFARAAALPAVGRDELLLAFLPLYHTFGRYLELMGMLYWGGTYAFAGNPSLDALLAGMTKVRPTGLISVPLRWQQIREHAEAEGGADLADLTGGRLRWGLSAAGWLAPDTFRWFHAHGVQLCSGFGMTEGTGGLTMTPPDDYREDSVGLPLPGVAVRLGPGGELQVAGPYVARYLPEDGPPGDLRVHDPADPEAWLGTGDLFETLADGHLRIVDRIKDIYKNNRGQTVAPRKVESRFAGVPGIASTFLAGDGRPYNVLLIVPDLDDPVLQGTSTAEREAYFQRIVRQANLDLAAYERVLEFAVLDRPFSAEHGELTPKGSFRRKAIANTHAELLEHLYRPRTLEWRGRELRVPDWVLRNLNALVDDIVLDGDDLVNRRNGARLALRPGSLPGWLRMGDLQYLPRGPAQRPLDLGQFARQPLLWIGNPSLQSFLPCRDGWDARFPGVDEQVRLPDRAVADGLSVSPPRRDDGLGQLDALCCDALFGESASARAAVLELEQRLAHAPPREAVVIRRRLEALAGHPELDVRCEAYRILVLDDPEPDYGRYLPAFVTSRRPFLCRDSIAAIAGGAREPRRLLSFRRRLHAYRHHLDWPADEPVRQIFRDLLQLLVDFARHHPENVATVRRELICWQLFDGDPELARHADTMRSELTQWHHERLEARMGGHDWSGNLQFQHGLTDAEISRLREVLGRTTFLLESVAFAFDTALDPATVPAGGIWVSRTLSQPFPSRYRVSINTETGRHYDLLVILRDDLDHVQVVRTFQLVASIRSWPDEAPVLPRLGAVRPDLGAASLAFASGLTVWDRIRQHAALPSDVSAYGRDGWRRLMVAGMATALVAWRHSNRQVVPGMVTPSNVLLPDRDWQRGRLVISLASWRAYRGPLDLARPLLLNFLRLPASHFHALAGVLDDHWLLEAVPEALGQAEAADFLDGLATAAAADPLPLVSDDFPARVRAFSTRLRTAYHPSLAVESATARFHAWRHANKDASPRACGDQLDSLVRLYRLDRGGELAVFTLFRDTFLVEAPAEASEVCERLLQKLFRHPDLRAARTVELGDLQAALVEPAHREALARLAFPQSAGSSDPAVRAVGDRAREHVVLQTEVIDSRDNRHTVREPRDAAEMGRLYRLFLRSEFPLAISEVDRHLVLVDGDEQLVGGIVWRLEPSAEPHLDGVVVTHALRGRGLARALLEDFMRRLADDGHVVLRTHFSLQGFFAGLGFRTDTQRGGLVRRLT